MGIWDWLADNSFNLLSAVGIIGGLWFTALSFRSETKTRRIANLISITDGHREIWKLYLNSPELAGLRCKGGHFNASSQSKGNDLRQSGRRSRQHGFLRDKRRTHY